MRLLYLIPGVMRGTKMGAAEIERRQIILQEKAFPGTVVEARDADEGPNSIESIYEEYLSIPDTVKKATEAEKEGFDGIVLGCFADPGIDALREMLTIPVAGPFETSIYTALTLGHKFSIITGSPEMTPVLEELVLAKGVAGHRLASVRAIDIDVLDMLDDEEMLRTRLMDAARACIENDRADTVILGCITLAFSGMDKEIENEFGIPCINPILTALKTCEGNAATGIRHSKKAYPLPRKFRSQR